MTRTRSTIRFLTLSARRLAALAACSDTGALDWDLRPDGQRGHTRPPRRHVPGHREPPGARCARRDLVSRLSGCRGAAGRHGGQRRGARRRSACRNWRATTRCRRTAVLNNGRGAGPAPAASVKARPPAPEQAAGRRRADPERDDRGDDPGLGRDRPGAGQRPDRHHSRTGAHRAGRGGTDPPPRRSAARRPSTIARLYNVLGQVAGRMERARARPCRARGAVSADPGRAGWRCARPNR